MTDGICPFAEWRPGVTAYGPGSTDRVGFCDHRAGGFYTTLQDPGFWNGHGYSVHFGISLKGEICQLVNIFDRAWGQGILGPAVSWPPYSAMGRRDPNQYLISTEHEDWSREGGAHPLPPVWTAAMYDADLRLKRWCVEEVRRVTGQDLLRFGIESLAGHHMFDAVSRAECPGPYWRATYRDRLWADLSGGGQEDPDMMIRHNAVAAWFEDREIEVGAGYVMQLRSDLQLPPEAKMVRLDLYLGGGGPLTIRDPSGLVAGVLEANEQHATVDVEIGPDGTCLFDLGFAGKVRRIGALGYWT